MLIWSIGPGLNKAIIAAISPKESGFNSVIYLVIPDPSNWKTPAVFPSDNISKVLSFWISGGISLKFNSTPLVFRTKSLTFAITDKFDNPRKSNFNNPKAATESIAYWVVGIPDSTFLVALCKGKIVPIGFWEITTPAAWVLECLIEPSRFWAIFINSAISLSLSTASRNSSDSDKASRNVIFNLLGIILAILSTSE